MNPKLFAAMMAALCLSVACDEDDLPTPVLLSSDASGDPSGDGFAGDASDGGSSGIQVDAVDEPDSVTSDTDGGIQIDAIEVNDAKTEDAYVPPDSGHEVVQDTFVPPDSGPEVVQDTFVPPDSGPEVVQDTFVPPQPQIEDCQDGIDNDLDGKVDAQDFECKEQVVLAFYLKLKTPGSFYYVAGDGLKQNGPMSPGPWTFNIYGKEVPFKLWIKTEEFSAESPQGFTAWIPGLEPEKWPGAEGVFTKSLPMKDLGQQTWINFLLKSP